MRASSKALCRQDTNTFSCLFSHNNLFPCSTAAAMFPPTYLRFSTLTVTDIQMQLFLRSEKYVFAMFQSMVIIHIIPFI